MALIGAVTAIGLLLRLPSFDDSLFADELSTYFIVTGRSARDIVHQLYGHSIDLNPPGFFLLAWAAERLGQSAQLLRVASLLAGTASIPLTYLLGTWTVGRRAGFVASALMALSPFLIFFSTEARPYALALVLVLGSTLSLLRALRSRRTRWWIAYATCSCAAIYCQFVPIFVLVAQFAWAFWTHADARRPLIAANAGAALAFLPWVPAVIDNSRSPGVKVIGALHPFGAGTVRVDLGRWWIGHSLLPLRSVPGLPAVVLAVVGLAVAILGIAWRMRARDATPRPSQGAVLVAVLALSAPVGLAGYSLFGDSVWEARNLITSWPGLALAIGAIVTAARGAVSAVAVACVVSAWAIGGIKMLESSHHRPDYAAAAALIATIGTPRDPVAELPFPVPGPLTPVGDVALNRLGQSSPGHHPVLRVGYPPLNAMLRAKPYALLPTTPAPTLAGRATALARGGRLFVVSPGARLSESALAFGGPLGEFLNALPRDVRLVESHTYRGLLPVTVYVFRRDRAA